MKRPGLLLAASILALLVATPVFAASLVISPPSVEFEVPANGSARVEFLVYDFRGDLDISLEDIPLQVEPDKVSVTNKKEGDRVELTFYGDESVASQVFDGKIRFLAMTGGDVAMGIKVKAKVSVVGEPAIPEPEEPGPPKITEEISPPAAPSPSQEEALTPKKTSPVPPPPAKTEWPVLPIAGIAAATIVAVTLIIVLVRRRSY